MSEDVVWYNFFHSPFPYVDKEYPERNSIEGKQQGMQRGMIQAAEEMLKEGIDIGIVQRVTKLSRQKIIAIKKKISN